MEKMNDLKDLLRHEIQDLYSAEEQIIAAMPSMIDKAKNPELKRALQNHLRATEQQRSRLEQVQNMLGGEEETMEEKKGLFTRLLKRRQVCRGMQGLIEEGTKVMNEDMDPDVLDAAIIGCAQKIEHYEICGYGTAKTFARELNLESVAQMLEQTLNEEYQADNNLTQLAITRINKQAETGATSKRSMEQMPGRSAGTRATTQERVRREEPEMETASNRSRTSATSKRSSTAGRGGTAPKGTETARTRAAEPSRTRGTESSRSTTASTRSTGTTSRSASGSRTSAGRTTASSGRTGTAGRTGTSSRTDTGSARSAGRSATSGRGSTTGRGSSRGR